VQEQILSDTYVGRNTINNVGQALETCIQDVFADTVTEDDSDKRNVAY
jgi:hypothetical protein